MCYIGLEIPILCFNTLKAIFLKFMHKVFPKVHTVRNIILA